MSHIESHWMPDDNSVVGVVKGKFHQVLDRETYLELLAEKLNALLQREPNPEEALHQLIIDLEDRLPDYPVPDLPENPSQDGNLYPECKLIMSALDSYLLRMGLLDDLPERLPPNVLAAQKVYEQNDLESWLTNLTNQPANVDR